MAYPYFAAAGPGGLAAVGGLQGTALGMMGDALENQYDFNAGLTTGSAIKDAMLGATGEVVLGPMIGKGMSWVGNKISPIYKSVVHKVSDLMQGENLVRKAGQNISKFFTNGKLNYLNLPSYTITNKPLAIPKILLNNLRNTRLSLVRKGTPELWRLYGSPSKHKTLIDLANDPDRILAQVAKNTENYYPFKE
jgi:hypothetical protein